MSRTLQNVLIDANSYLDLDAALPTGDDLDVRIAYAQQAVREWSEAGRWKELSTPLNLFVTSATLSLSTDFKELEVEPLDVSKNQYPQIEAKEAVNSNSTDKFCFVTGNNTLGHTIEFNGLSSSLASLSTVYQRLPTNMTLTTDVCEVPDDMFVVQSVIAMVLASRSDERFPIVEADAKRRLNNMLGRGMIQTPGGDMKIRRTNASTWRIGTSRG